MAAERPKNEMCSETLSFSFLTGDIHSPILHEKVLLMKVEYEHAPKTKTHNETSLLSFQAWETGKS